MHLQSLIALATIHGATVHTTRDGEAISTVQVIGMPGMSAWPLPRNWAERELRDAVRGAS